MIGSLLCGRRQLSLAFDLFELLIECRAGGGRRGGAGVGVGGEMVVGGAKDVGTFLGEARQIGRDLGTADKRTFGGLGFVDGALLTILGVEQLDAHVFGHLFHRDLLTTARTHLHTRRTRQLLAVVATKVAADLARVNVGRGQRQAFRCVVARLHVHVHVHVHVVVALLVAARTSSVACTGRLRHAAVGRGETCQCAQLRHRDQWRQFAHIVVVKLDLAGHRELVPVDGRVQFALTVVGRLRLQSLLHTPPVSTTDHNTHSNSHDVLVRVPTRTPSGRAPSAIVRAGSSTTRALAPRCRLATLLAYIYTHTHTHTHTSTVIVIVSYGI